MAEIVDLELLRQVTTDSMGVYEAVRRAKTLTAESEPVLAMAEDLLRQAGLAYLLEGLEIKPDQPDKGRTDPEEMVSAYVRIQQLYPDLKDALRRLAEAQIDARAWGEARTALGALLKIEPGQRDAELLLTRSYLDEAESLFEQEKLAEGQAVLKARLVEYPVDWEARLEYLKSFLRFRFKNFEAPRDFGKTAKLWIQALWSVESQVATRYASESAWNTAWSLEDSGSEVWAKQLRSSLDLLDSSLSDLVDRSRR